MERKLYLELCQKVSVLKNGICGIKENVPDELKVVYNGNAYYPVAYKLSFDDKGNVRHTAILHDLKANSITSADLGKVEKHETHQMRRGAVACREIQKQPRNVEKPIHM